MDGIRNEYVEHIVKRRDPAYIKVLLVAAGLLTLVLLLLSLSSPILLLLFFGGAALTYYLWLKSHTEYEYLYIDGTLSVDEIMNKSRRKQLLETRGEELLLAAPKNSDAVKDQLPGAKIQDLSGDGPEDRKYAYIYARNGERYCIYIEATEALLREIRYHAPQKMKRQ